MRRYVRECPRCEDLNRELESAQQLVKEILGEAETLCAALEDFLKEVARRRPLAAAARPVRQLAEDFVRNYLRGGGRDGY